MFVRNDTLHRRCEHLTDKEHHHIHIFIEPQQLNDKKNRFTKVAAARFPIYKEWA